MTNINKELELFFTQEEIEKAMNDESKGIKTKSLKLHLENIEDRLLFNYLEEKSFTDVIKKALKIYKKHFDTDVLLREKLHALNNAPYQVEQMRQMLVVPQVQETAALPRPTIPTVPQTTAQTTTTSADIQEATGLEDY